VLTVIAVTGEHTAATMVMLIVDVQPCIGNSGVVVSVYILSLLLSVAASEVVV